MENVSLKFLFKKGSNPVLINTLLGSDGSLPHKGRRSEGPGSPGPALPPPSLPPTKLGSLSNADGNGSENAAHPKSELALLQTTSLFF